MSHCELFNHPQGLFSCLLNQGHSPQVIRMADDVILLDAIVPRPGSKEGVSLSVLGLTHEAYADARAVFFLIQDGYTTKQLHLILDDRQNNPMDRIHDTGSVVAEILSMDASRIKSLTLEQIDVESKKLDTTLALRKIMGEGALGHGDGHFIDSSLRYQINEIRTMLKEQSLTLTDFLIDASLQRPSDLAPYGTLRWIATKGKHLAKSSTEDDFFKWWIEDLYQMQPIEFKNESKKTALFIESKFFQKNN